MSGYTPRSYTVLQWIFKVFNGTAQTGKPMVGRGEGGSEGG